MHPFVPPSLKFRIKGGERTLKSVKARRAFCAAEVQVVCSAKMQLRLKFGEKISVNTALEYPGIKKYLLIQAQN